MSMFHELCLLGTQVQNPEVAQKIEEAIKLTDEFNAASELNAMLASGCLTFAEWRNAMVKVLV